MSIGNHVYPSLRWVNYDQIVSSFFLFISLKSDANVSATINVLNVLFK